MFKKRKDLYWGEDWGDETVDQSLLSKTKDDAIQKVINQKSLHPDNYISVCEYIRVVVDKDWLMAYPLLDDLLEDLGDKYGNLYGLKIEESTSKMEKALKRLLKVVYKEYIPRDFIKTGKCETIKVEDFLVKKGIIKSK
jgi:hypothetical protein